MVRPLPLGTWAEASQFMCRASSRHSQGFAANQAREFNDGAGGPCCSMQGSTKSPLAVLKASKILSREIMLRFLACIVLGPNWLAFLS